MMKRARKRDRIRQIIAVFIKHGITKGIKDPANLRHAFEELGPTFVKMGQMLSTRPDIIPPAYQKEFQKLQDTVPPEPFEKIRAAIESGLGRPMETVFPVFDQKAIAAASLAEVHRAALPNGDEVAVKVQRPMARETITNDFAILRLLSRFFKIKLLFDVVNVPEILDEMEKNILLELDFLAESRNIRQFAQNNQEIRCIAAPKVYDTYTSETILVMQYIRGIRIKDVKELDEQGYDRQDIGTKLANNYMKQIFEDGFFHADPHPGNILVSGEQIVYVDFGLMGTLDKWTRKRLNDLFRGIASNDMDMMSEAILRLGVQKGPVNTERFHNEIAVFYEKYIDASFDALNIGELAKEMLRICQRNGIVIPKEVTMLGKGLMIMESVLANISPDINMMTITANYGMRQVLHSENLRQHVSEVLRNAYQSGSLGIKIPAKLFRLVDKMQAGGFTVNVRDSDRDRFLRRVDRMVNRAILCVLVSALFIGSSVILHTGAGGKWNGFSWIGLAGYGCAAVIGFFLLIGILRSN